MMHKTTFALLAGLITYPIAGKEATLLYDGYHFRMPVEFSHDKILLDPRQLPKNILVQDFGLKKTIPYKATHITVAQSGPDKPDLLHRGKSLEEIVQTMSFAQASSLLIFADPMTYKYEPEPLPLSIQNAMHAADQAIDRPATFFSAFLQLLAQGRASSSDKDKAAHLLNVMPSYVAYTCRLLSGKKGILNPQKNLSIAENFMYMYMGDDFNKLPPKIQKAFSCALEGSLIIHADHGITAATATVRNAASAATGISGSVSAGCNVLFGELSMNTSEKVIDLLHRLKSRDAMLDIIEELKATNNPRHLAGFSLRTYKGPDPRVRLIRKQVIELTTLLKEENLLSQEAESLLDAALEFERMAAKDPYFKQNKIYPNINFYSGLLYQLIGLPRRCDAVMFAFARLSGWLAHWFEQNTYPTPVICPHIVYAADL